MRTIRSSLVHAAIAVTIVSAPACGQLANEPAWGRLAGLVGTWSAESGSGGQPGVAVRGGETWTRDLNGQVLLRREYSEYPATPSRAAFRHEGLTVISPATEGGFVAHSYDTEGHVIDYVVIVTDSAIVFTSRPAASAPQFRLTYRARGARYAVIFQIAPPGHPEQFQDYVTGVLRRTP